MERSKNRQTKWIFAVILTAIFALTAFAGAGLFGGKTQTALAAGVVAPTKDDDYFRIFANGTAVVIKEDAGLTKIYAASDSDNALFGGMDIGNYIIYGGWATGGETGNTSVTINSGTLLKTVYGGSRQGSLIGNTAVTVNGGTLTYLYGGGAEAPVTGNTSVTINDGSFIVEVSGGGNAAAVYGGGNTAASIVNGNTSVTINGGSFAWVFGGGYEGSVTGNTSVTINGGSFQDICGGGFNGPVAGGTSVTINGGTVLYEIYGGGMEPSSGVAGTAHISIKGDCKIPWIYGGGCRGSVGGIIINIKGGIITGNGVCGFDPQGSIDGDVIINVEGGTITGSVCGVWTSTGSENVDVTINIFPGAVITGGAKLAGRGETAGPGSKIVNLTAAQVEQMVAEAKTTLTWNVIKGTNTAQNNVTANLVLPLSGANGTHIYWSSNSPMTVSPDGTVTRSENSDIEIMLIATITIGGVSDTVTFDLTVKKLSQISPATYTVTVTVTGGAASPVSGAAGTTVTLTAGAAPEGKRFKEWKVVSGGVTVTGGTFTIGTENVVIEAVWENIPKGGLSGGAITGIVIGSVIAAGLGGFAIFWFVIRKRSFPTFSARKPD